MSNPAAPAAPAPPPHSWGDALLRAYQAFGRELHGHLREAGYPDLRPAYFAVFHQVGATGARVSAMAAGAQMTKQAMAELVAYLEGRGYVERVPDPRDRRAKIVRLTEKGWEAARAGQRGIAGIEARWRARVGEDALEEAYRVLAMLAGGADP